MANLGPRSATDRLRLAVVTDIHCGRNLRYKRGEEAIDRLGDFAAHVHRTRPDGVLDLGDRISDAGLDEDQANLQKVSDVFKSIDRQCYHLVGNHDVKHLDRSTSAAILDAKLTSYFDDIGSWRLVFWQPSVLLGPRGLEPAETEEISWLVEAVEGSVGRAVVFSHAPVSGHSMQGNRYFEGRVDWASYPNRDDVMRAIRRTGKLAAWISGHAHWNSICFRYGTPHFTLQSLTEANRDECMAVGAFTDIELSDQFIRVQVHGSEPMQLDVPI